MNKIKNQELCFIEAELSTFDKLHQKALDNIKLIEEQIEIADQRNSDLHAEYSFLGRAELTKSSEIHSLESIVNRPEV